MPSPSGCLTGSATGILLAACLAQRKMPPDFCSYGKPCPMRITNLNPDTAIGASAWLVEIDGDRILLDAGIHPKREGRDSLPLYDLVKE